MSKVCIGDIIQRVKNKANKDETELEYYVGGEHFDSGEVTVTRYGKIAGSTIGPAFNTCFEKGDVLLMSRNPHLRKAGMVGFDGICSDVSYICRTRDESVLLQEFIPFIYQSDAFWEFAEANKRGSTNFFLNWSDFERYEFELPSLSVQKELVEVLWAADKTKKSYQNLIKSTDELVKSQFIEMFGNPVTDDKGWDFKPLPNVTTIVLGTTPKSSEPEYWDGNVKWITPAELEDGTFEIFDSVRHITEKGVKSAGLRPFPKGTVVFSTRAPIGKTAIAGCEMYCNQGFKNFVCGPKVNPVYLFSALRFNKDYFISLGTGNTFKELSKARLEQISISVPPIELQNEFEALYRQSDKSKFELEQSLAELTATYKRIISENLG